MKRLPIVLLTITVIAVAALLSVGTWGTPSRAREPTPTPSPTPTPIITSATIDFEKFARGTIVDSVSCFSGITCAPPVDVSVSVFGFNPTIPGNTAMIFDATCPGGCTGSPPDNDLKVNPADRGDEAGNVLIICEEVADTDKCNAGSPDDADVPGMRFDFDFFDFGPGTVLIHSLVIGDVDANPGTIEVFSGGPSGALVKSVDIPLTGNGKYEPVTIEATGDFLRININDSAAIDNIEVQIPLPTSGSEPPFEPEKWNYDGKTEDLKDVQGNNNCYNYACNRKSGSVGPGDFVTGGGAKPGRSKPDKPQLPSGRPPRGVDGYNCEAFRAAAKNDGLGDPVDCAKACPRGTYKKALFLADDTVDGQLVRKDFHWYRQDSNAKWSHKGGDTEVTNKDAAGNEITDPRTANRRYERPYLGRTRVLDYKTFCGCFCCDSSNVTKE